MSHVDIVLRSIYSLHFASHGYPIMHQQREVACPFVSLALYNMAGRPTGSQYIYYTESSYRQIVSYLEYE